MGQIETDVKRLYLGPGSGKGFENVGNGLYLMKHGGLYDGRGIILGHISPFKNIPILGMIFEYFFQKKIKFTLKKLKFMKLMVKLGIYIVLK